MKTITEIATSVGGTITGDNETTALQLCSEQAPQPRQAVVVSSVRSADTALAAGCSIVIGVDIPPTKLAKGSGYVRVSDHQLAFAQLLQCFAPQHPFVAARHPSAVIHPSSQVDDKVRIGPNVLIGPNCKIGPGVHIHANVAIGGDVQIGEDCECFSQVTIYPGSIIGKRVRLHAGAVIGSDGFGYYFADGQHHKQQHLGHVIIEDDVEVGANTAIDRATLGETRIGAGTKIDNHVQIAHNVKLGRCNIVCAFTGIAGSVTSGDFVTFAADVGVADHVTIEDQVTLGARTGIAPNKRLPEGTVWLGNPGRLKDKAVAQIVALNRLPDIRQKVLNLQTQLNALAAKLSDQEDD